uniref:RusA family crossover junction endodeoxyribonuclease n=1 Tax=Globodera pallida TaxID=36090 RepID=A0A183BR16_GLOPA
MANIDPFLKIYHKCDDKEGKKGYRRITLRYPREYVTIGRVPRRNYNVGNLNLVLQYPNEARIDELKGI